MATTPTDAIPSEAELLAQQLCRLWAGFTDIFLPGNAAPGLTFAEDGFSTKANLYARDLPFAKHRGLNAISITPQTEVVRDRPEVLREIAFVAEAHAPTRRTALRMLEDLRSLLRPDKHWGATQRTHGGAFNRSGIVGVKPHYGTDDDGQVVELFADGTTERFWRLRTSSIIAGPQPLAIEASNAATPSGGGSAQMTFSIVGVLEDAFPAPLRAFDIFHDGTGIDESSGGEARVEVSTDFVGDAEFLLLQTRADGVAELVEVPIALTPVITIAQLVGFIDGIANWSASIPVGYEADSARPSLDLEPQPSVSALLAANTRTLRAWA